MPQPSAGVVGRTGGQEFCAETTRLRWLARHAGYWEKKKSCHGQLPGPAGGRVIKHMLRNMFEPWHALNAARSAALGHEMGADAPGSGVWIKPPENMSQKNVVRHSRNRT